MFNPAHYSAFHLVIASLMFLCFLFGGLHENFLSVVVPRESHLIAPISGKNETKTPYGTNLKGKIPPALRPAPSLHLWNCPQLSGVALTF